MKIMSFEGTKKKQETHCDGLTCFCPVIGTHSAGAAGAGAAVILKINWEHVFNPSNCNELQWTVYIYI